MRVPLTNAPMSRQPLRLPASASTRSNFRHPVGGRACPARALSTAARYCFTHPGSPLHRREES